MVIFISLLFKTKTPEKGVTSRLSVFKIAHRLGTSQERKERHNSFLNYEHFLFSLVSSVKSRDHVIVYLCSESRINEAQERTESHNLFLNYEHFPFFLYFSQYTTWLQHHEYINQ